MNTNLERQDLIEGLLQWFKIRLDINYGECPIDKLNLYRAWLENEPTDYIENIYKEYVIDKPFNRINSCV